MLERDIPGGVNTSQRMACHNEYVHSAEHDGRLHGTDHVEPAAVKNHGQMTHGGGSGHTGTGSQGGHSKHGDVMMADFNRRLKVSAAISIPILVLSPAIQGFAGLQGKMSFAGETHLLWALSTVVFFYGGLPFFKGIRDELKAKSPGMMTLIALAISVSYVYSTAVVFGLSGDVFFWELATLIDVMLLGHIVEMRSIMSASSALQALAKLMPSQAHKISADGQVMDIPRETLLAGDRIIVKPGEKVPADGKVVDGESSVNEALLTGESNPVTKRSGARVIGGSLNGEGSITVEVEKTGGDSYVAQMTELVRQAQESKSRTQNLADRAALWLTVIAIGAGLLTLAVWMGMARKDFVFALSRMVTVMVITCPHALGLAIPLVVSMSTSISARSGILIKDRAGFELARNVKAILFDKTGTLTLGEFGITDVLMLDGRIDREVLLKYAASVESHSEHPIARGIVSSVKDVFPVEEFKSIPGRGAQGRVNGKTVMAVSPGYLKENGTKISDDRIDGLSEQGKTVIYVMVDGAVAGAIALADVIRPESRGAVAELKAMGIRCMMLTGDNRQVARWVADEVGLDEYFAEVLPGKKAEKVREIQARGVVVAMTGDGVNDAPALAQADVGIAIGAGTDVAMATADVVLVRSNPADVVTVIKLSRATYRKMAQNLGWATGYNAVAIPLAAGVAYNAGIVLNPAAGAALMALSTVIVAINARTLKMAK